MDDSRRKTFTLIATILGSTIVFLDGTVVNVALPAISDDLNASLADQQWIVEAYMLATVAPTSETLVAFRGLQGFAGALLVPGSLAILTATFEGADRGKAIGTWTAWTGIATVFGP